MNHVKYSLNAILRMVLSMSALWDSCGFIIARYDNGQVYEAGGWNSLYGYYENGTVTYCGRFFNLAGYCDQGTIYDSGGWSHVLAHYGNGIVYVNDGYDKIIARYDGDDEGGAASALLTILKK